MNDRVICEQIANMITVKFRGHTWNFTHDELLAGSAATHGMSEKLRQEVLSFLAERELDKNA